MSKKKKRKLNMYDPLWEVHPRIKKIKAEADKAKAEAAEAEATKAIIEAVTAKAWTAAKLTVAEAKLAEEKARVEKLKVQLKRAMVFVVRTRFPKLTELAQQTSRQIENPDILGFLLEQIESAKDEAEARIMLRLPAA
ncbi:MAG: hypothetical protein ABI234_03210 [Ktedonobacteraceae bacterium]